MQNIYDKLTKTLDIEPFNLTTKSIDLYSMLRI